MKVSDVISVFICVVYNIMDVILVGVMTTELPKILKDVDCKNGTSCEENGWKTPGFALTFFNIPAVLFCVPIGLLTRKLDTKLMFTVGLLMHLIGHVILIFNQTFLFLILAIFCDGVGCALGGVSGSDIIRRILPSDGARCRVMNVCALGRVIGFATSFYFVTLSYEELGSVVTFTITATIHFLFFITMTMVAITGHRPGESSAQLEHTALIERNGIHTEQKDKENVSKISSYLAILKHYRIIFMIVQVFFIQSAISVVMSTAPAHLQFEVGFTAVKDGLIIGLALALSFTIILCVIVSVRTNLARVVCIIVFVSAEATGIAIYPFATTFTVALFAEFCLQSARNLLNALHSSLLMRITDVETFDFAKTNALYIFVRFGSQSIGSVTSAFLVSWLGFEDLYLTLAGFLVPVAVSSFIYFRLPVKN